jgi:hypothetical protein
MTTSSTHPAALPHLLGNLADEGIPLTKASYLWAMYAPELPDLPVSDEVAARIPDTLPGDLPQTYAELLKALPTR